MTIVRCPRCRDEVTVPAKATARALVRCPLCLEEFLLSEALANAPPPLVIIGGEVEQAAIESSPVAGDEYRLAGSSFAGAFEASAPALPSGLAPRPATRIQPRPRRKEKSGLILLVNYVVGGVLGLSLGLLVLWWGFRKDPLELGPPIGRYTPWIVPAEFRAQPTSDSHPATSDGAPLVVSDGGSGSMEAPRDGKKKRGSKTSGVAKQQQQPTAELQTLPGLDEPARLPGAASTPIIDAPDLNEGGAAQSLRSEEPKPPMPDLTDLLPDGQLASAAPKPDHQPPATAAEFAELVDTAVAALVKYARVPRGNNDEQRQAFSELHAAAGEVGRALAGLNAADPRLAASVAKLNTLLGDLTGKTGTSRVRAIKFLTLQKWPAAADGEGLVAAGTVIDFRSAGSLFELQLDATARDMTLAILVVMTNDPRDICKPGDEVLVIGRVIDQPRQNLAGYEGQQPRVLLSAFAVRVPASE